MLHCQVPLRLHFKDWEQKLEETHLASITNANHNYEPHQEHRRPPKNHATYSSADRFGASVTRSPSPGFRRPYRPTNSHSRNVSPSSSRTYYRRTNENVPSPPASQTSHDANQNVRNYQNNFNLFCHRCNGNHAARFCRHKYMLAGWDQSILKHIFGEQ